MPKAWVSNESRVESALRNFPDEFKQYLTMNYCASCAEFLSFR